MSLLRQILSNRAVNHTARAAGRLVMAPEAYARFDRKLPLVDPFVIKLPNGAEIQWEPQRDICSKFLKYDGWDGYERSSVRLFYELAGVSEVIFDVGAYLGYFGLLAAAARAGNRAWVFEAVPMLAEKCRRLASINPGLRAQVVSAAVGDTAGTLPLYLPKDPFDSDTSTNGEHRPNRTRIDVPAVRLDDFVREQNIPRVDLLKIDTESTEPDVLAGMFDTIRRDRPTLLIEVLAGADIPRLTRMFKELDYAFAWVRSDGPVTAQSIIPDPAAKDLNYIFYPRQFATPAAARLQHLLRNP